MGRDRVFPRQRRNPSHDDAESINDGASHVRGYHWRRRHKMKASIQTHRAISLAAVMAVIILLALAAFQFAKPSKRLPLPNPNGFDDIFVAGKMLKGDWPDRTNNDLSVIRGYVESN